MEQAQKISAIKVQKKNPNRVSVYLNGQYAFGLSRIVAVWLDVGQELSPEKIATLQAQDFLEMAYQQALRFLNLRQRSQAEVERNLKEHQYPPEVIIEVVDRLKGNGLLDDQRFAQLWVENRSEFRPRGKRMLRMELRQRGMQAEAIEAALQDIDESFLAYQAGLKQARKLKNLEWPQFRQKMGAFLARRGFNYEDISQVVEQIWHESRSDQPDW